MSGLVDLTSYGWSSEDNAIASCTSRVFAQALSAFRVLITNNLGTI
jgi:hypothetical protein